MLVKGRHRRGVNHRRKKLKEEKREGNAGAAANNTTEEEEGSDVRTKGAKSMKRMNE